MILVTTWWRSMEKQVALGYFMNGDIACVSCTFNCKAVASSQAGQALTGSLFRTLKPHLPAPHPLFL